MLADVGVIKRNICKDYVGKFIPFLILTIILINVQSWKQQKFGAMLDDSLIGLKVAG